MKELLANIATVAKEGKFEVKTYSCTAVDSEDPLDISAEANAFEKTLRDQIVSNSRLLMLRNEYSLEFYMNISIFGQKDDLTENTLSARSGPREIAFIGNSNDLMLIDNSTIKPTRRFFRIGIAEVTVFLFFLRVYNSCGILIVL